MRRGSKIAVPLFLIVSVVNAQVMPQSKFPSFAQLGKECTFPAADRKVGYWIWGATSPQDKTPSIRFSVKTPTADAEPNVTRRPIPLTLNATGQWELMMNASVNGPRKVVFTPLQDGSFMLEDYHPGEQVPHHRAAFRC
jgi:hypothetical protein